MVRLGCVGLVLASCAAAWSASAEITAAEYGAPTTRYPHGALGDPVEYGTLTLSLADGTQRRILLPESRVFEDTAPRLADLNGDGRPEIVTVEADVQQGARLAVYGVDGLIAATEPIGTRFRWLAVAGIGDLDGDGHPEIAYVDRPHLAKTLRIVRLDQGKLTEIATLRGVTNHRFGDPQIEGGYRDCAGQGEIVLASADWRDLLAIRLGSDGLSATRLAPYSRSALERARTCQN